MIIRTHSRCLRRAIPIALALFCVFPVAAKAATLPPFFGSFPENPLPALGAGQLYSPKGIAADPSTNHRIYVTDLEQVRVNVFSPWGEFLHAFGWGVADGANELQTCVSSCREGIVGEGPGQFGRVPMKSQYEGPTGIEADAEGNVYVMDLGNARVQKFDPEGNFLLMFGGGVNKGPNHPGDVCTAQHIVEGDTCGAGTRGAGPSEIGTENVSTVLSDHLTVGPDGLVYVGDKDRIQAFGANGAYQASIPLPRSGNPGSLAADPVSGDLYFLFSDTPPPIYRLDHETGKVLDEISPEFSSEPFYGDILQGLAVDREGNLYVGDRPRQSPRQLVVMYGPSGDLVGTFSEVPDNEGPRGGEEAANIPAIAAGVVGNGPGDIGFYAVHAALSGEPDEDVAHVKVFGAVPDPDVVGPPPKAPPQIQAQYAATVGQREATLKARINPKFWDDTSFYVEYGQADCDSNPCRAFPPSPGSRLTTKVIGNAITTTGLQLAGLQPDTTYHYRFLAQSTGSGGTFVAGPDRTFTTRPLPRQHAPCSGNEAFRVGPGANLPDCRAYELVTPVEKNGADIAVVYNVTGYPAGFNQAASSGETVSFASYRAFGDTVSAPYAVQYLAERDPEEGWSSRGISAPRSGPSVLEGATFDAPYKAFSGDLSDAWLLHDTPPSLDPAAPVGYANLYRRDNLTGAYEALITTTPPNLAPSATSARKFLPEVQGYGGGCTVFRANDKLTSNALANGNAQLYRSCPGEPLELLSVLPTGARAAQASAGTAAAALDEGNGQRLNRTAGAVSSDGSVVFWSDRASIAGNLLARLPESDETIALSKGAAQFWAAAADGSKAIFTELPLAATEDGNLYEFTLGVNAPKAPTLIATGVKGVLGASADASVVYFLSTADLDSGATAGRPNLYRHQAGGSLEFIATLAAADLELKIANPIRPEPVRHTAHVTPDGGAVAFNSVAPLTGFDNLDAQTGKANAEVFVYHAGQDRLLCVSCDPSGVRPSGRETLAKARGSNGTPQPFAAELPTAVSQLHAPRVISENGNRVYFNSYVPLVPGDTNGKADVYQWESLGEGGCTQSAPGYDELYAGCVGLISSGTSPEDSEFVDAGTDGRDVFFKTNSSLLPQDPGLVDIYDARAGGGFPLPAPPPPECQGENCQSPAPPPSDGTPASAAFHGPGNATQRSKPRKPRCAKGKKRRGRTCVKKHGRKQRRAKKRAGKPRRVAKANETRRAGR